MLLLRERSELNILAEAEKNAKCKCVNLARVLELRVSMLNTIVAKSQQIRENAKDFESDMKKTKGARHVQLEEILPSEYE